MTDRFHRAARDGVLELLKEATRKDSNSRDDDGMTPTLWAVFEGNFEALRLLIGRGGDPEKCDHYGNAALHFAAARGHMNCVSFLLHYGVNIYAKDIDHHTAKDLAAMNNHDDILRLLDDQATREAGKNPKKVRTLQEKATKEADKRVKEFHAVQEKARKLADKEQKRLDKERQRMENSGYNTAAPTTTAIPRASMAALNLRKDSRIIYGQSPKFSDLVNQKQSVNRAKVPISAVYAKVQKHRSKFSKQGDNTTTTTTTPATTPATPSAGRGSTVANNDNGDFKVGSMADGKRSVRSISGLRRDSEIMYVPKFDHVNGGRTESSEIGSRPDFLIADGSVFADEKVAVYQQPRTSIFDRPGFGSLAFRNSMAALADGPKAAVENSAGSAGSLKQRQLDPSDDDDDDDDDDDEESELTPLHFFLTAVGLEEFVEPFVKERFDLDSLMLVKESDLVDMHIPRGYRLKLMQAITQRRAALDDPSDLEDCHL